MPMLEGETGKEEKINGMIYDMSPSPDYRHGVVNNNVNTIIKQGLRQSLCLVFMENLDFLYQPEINDDYVIPDIMVVCDRKKLKGGGYTGVPQFIAETLSPSTAMRDMAVKKEIYERAGVPEYWIISPKERAVQIYYLIDDAYILSNSFILEDDKDNKYYNAETVITLREFPHIKMTLGEMFEGME